MGADLQPPKQRRMHSSFCFVASLAVASANVASQVTFNGMTRGVNHLAGGDRLAAAAHATALQAQGFQGGFQGPATTGFQGPASTGFQVASQGSKVLPLLASRVSSRASEVLPLHLLPL